MVNRESRSEKASIQAESRDIVLAINQVEYSNTPDGPLIHIFGRTADKEAFHLQVTGFQPYFYVPLDQADDREHPPQVTVDREREFTSIREDALRRLITRRPTDVRDIRDNYHHFEADIPFATRFMIDCGLTGGVRSPGVVASYRDLAPAEVNAPARVCMMDIECEDRNGFPDPERDAIICITCHDSFDDEFESFIYQPPDADECDMSLLSRQEGRENGCFVQGRHHISTHDSEASMLKGFAGYIRRHDPDILSGWNFVEFDMPYVRKRMEALGMQVTMLSRLEGQVERNALRGRALFDLLSAYKKMHATQKESYRLDSIAEEELGDTKVRYRGTISDLWRKDPCTLVEYNYKDVELCVRINEKSRIIEFYREIARYVGCPLDRTLNSSNIIDIFVLRKAHGKYVLPSKGFARADEFEGATVFEPSRGVRENVVVLDLKSLYPMAMMTINASPETKDPDGALKAPNGIRFRKEPDGLTRSIISELLTERDQKKRERNAHPFGSPEYVLYDLQQNVLKVIMNTYYGVSGYSRFRLYDREIGSAITSVGRAIIEHTRKVIEGMDYRVIYGDTDSCMVMLHPGAIEETIRIARQIEETVNASYGEFALRELNADTHYFSIKFEKVYRRFFQAGKKKRYAGHLVWKEGSDVDQIDVIGFEIRRSDYPSITKVVQRKVMEMILYGEGYDVVKEYLGEVIRNYRAGKYSLDEIGIPGGIGKHLEDYQNDDAHIRGAKYANEHLGMDFTKGSKPKRVYIKNVTSRYKKTDVLCFEYGDQVPPQFQVDWELMLNKTLKLPISRIIEALGWQWTDIDPSRTTLAQWGIG
ncbi:MAG TPA: DNA-directed DNA polymerase [Methanoregulaceae archaeon]|nr:DNA-directed DNA polymerase [Methanoregulaceae archaeon]